MAYAVCLQDWITVNGNTNTVTQPECDWLDIQGFQDIALYLELGNVTVNATDLRVQASPTKDESFFGASLAGLPYLYQWALAAGTQGVQAVQVLRWATAANQLPARYVRWQLSAMPATSSVSFRIWLSLNQAGWGGGVSSAGVAGFGGPGNVASMVAAGRLR